MKITFTFFMFILSFCVEAQVQDSITKKMLLDYTNQMQSLKWKVDDLQASIDDLNSRNEKFAKTNNIAGLLYFGGVALACINYSVDEPSDAVYYASGGMVLLGTAILYFSSNKLILKNYRSNSYRSRHPKG